MAFGGLLGGGCCHEVPEIGHASDDAVLLTHEGVGDVHRLDLAFHQTYGVAAAQFDADQLAQLGFHGGVLALQLRLLGAVITPLAEVDAYANLKI